MLRQVSDLRTHFILEHSSIDDDESNCFFPFNDSVQKTNEEIDLIDEKPNLESIIVNANTNSSEEAKYFSWEDEEIKKLKNLTKTEPTDVREPL